jgi:malate dehydrogenase (oxaloacetate-decarboxylating)
VQDLRSVAVTVAAAVARQARAEGLCEAFDDRALEGLIAQKMWEPVYRPYYRKREQ